MRTLARRWARRLRGETSSPVRESESGTFIFIHINKTGGTSVAEAIGLPEKQHLTVQEVIEQVGRAAWDASYTFAFVRNPWDRVVSHYKYRVQTRQTGLGSSPLDFSTWLARTYGAEQDPFYYDKPRMFQPQLEWLKDDRGALSIDRIGRFESLVEDFDEIRMVLGLERPLKHLNPTAPSDYRAFYDDTSRKTVARWFADDIDAFDYSF